MPTASDILCATHTPQEEPDTVNIVNFITELFCKVDDASPTQGYRIWKIAVFGMIVSNAAWRGAK